jgi:hypothetical protein
MSAIVIAYEKGSGGNFLANCLALNDYAVFRSLRLCKQQIHENFDPNDKLNFLLTELSKITEHNSWTDLGLGDPTIDEYDFYKKLTTKSFFLSAHTPEEVIHWKEHFKDLRIISIRNSRSFLLEYRPGRLKDYTDIIELKKYWAKIRLPDWPEHPPSYQESLLETPFNTFNLLSDSTLLSLLPNWQQVNDYYYNCDQALAAGAEFSWNAEWFLNKDQLCNEITQMYQHLNFSKPDLEKISRYYDEWTAVMKKYIT